jgi:hypothetical protein
MLKRKTRTTDEQGRSSRKMGTLLKGFAATTVLATVTAATMATPASAAPASALGCQSTYATLYTYVGPVSWNCSGAHYYSAYATSFSAGGWSGAVYTDDQGTVFFCDGDSFSVNGAHVYEVYLNATRPNRCK